MHNQPAEAFAMLDSTLTIYHFEVEIFTKPVWSREFQTYKTKYIVVLREEEMPVAEVSGYSLYQVLLLACEKAESLNTEFLQRLDLT